MAKRISLYGIMVTLMLIMSYLESLLPVILPVPGAKLGLTNCLALFLLLKYGLKEAMLINVSRIILSNILFGTVLSCAFALAGGVLSCLAMFFVTKLKGLSPIGISAVGGTVHNIAQTFVGAIVLKSAVFLYYIPPLMLLGLLAGTVTGLVTTFLLKRTEKIKIL